MLAVSNFFCVFLLTCFDNKVYDRSPHCPSSCKCYNAPAEGYKWSQESVSVICDINELSKDRDQLKQLGYFESINTLALSISGEVSSTGLNLFHNEAKLTHLYLEDTQPVDKKSTLQGWKDGLPSLPYNKLLLKFITFRNMNLNRFHWIGLRKKLQLTGLKGVHIEACQLDTLTKDNFGSLGAWMIRTLTIVSSDDGPLQTINADVFTDWYSLRMLTITKSQIKSIDWTKDLRTSDLWYLDLSDNYIETIPKDLFKSLPKLKELNLDNNNIKTLSWQQLLPGLSRLTTFSINGNLLCFDQNAVDFYKEYTQYSGSFPKFFDESLAKKYCQIMPENEVYLNDTQTLKDNAKHCRDIMTNTPNNPELCAKWKGNKNYK